MTPRRALRRRMLASKLIASVTVLLLILTPLASASVGIGPEDCDPHTEDCCPVYLGWITLEFRHWRACVPVRERPAEAGDE